MCIRTDWQTQLFFNSGSNACILFVFKTCMGLALSDLAVGYYLQKPPSESVKQSLILAMDKDAEVAVVGYMKVCLQLNDQNFPCTRYFVTCFIGYFFTRKNEIYFLFISSFHIFRIVSPY